MSDDPRHLDDLLRSLDGDAGCTAGEGILDAYVDLELAGEDPAAAFPGHRDPPAQLSRLPRRSRRAAGGGARVRRHRRPTDRGTARGTSGGKNDSSRRR